MYAWLCSKLPRPLVHALHVAWYAGLLLLVVLLADRPATDFYYLHG